MTFLKDDSNTVNYHHWIHMTTHCINTIRQSLMCHAEMSAMGFDWVPELQKYEN